MKPVSVYSRDEYEELDIGALMRLGHPFIQEGDEYITSLVEQKCAQLIKHSPVIFELGCGSGVLTRILAERIPHAHIVANEVEPNLVALARTRLLGSSVRIFDHSFIEWESPLDILISWGSHHHVRQEHLDHVRRLLGPKGLFILGDEFCPEYCNAGDQTRLVSGDRLKLLDGFVLTSAAEVDNYLRSGEVPQAAKDMERRRQHALWHWYKYVIDYALERGDTTVASAELQIAANDLTTSFDGEHKISPLIVERDLELRGFQIVSKHGIGPADPRLKSFFFYEIITGGAR